MKRDAVYIADIKQAVERILTYTRLGRDAFLKDVLIQDAVLRNFQVMGEAAKRISNETKAQFPNVPWSEMIGFRNVVIHDYSYLDLDKLWDTIQKDVPELMKSVNDIE